MFFLFFFRGCLFFSNLCSGLNSCHLFSLQTLTRGALPHWIIHHICTSASKFPIKSSSFLCSMSHSLIHHSRQGDWAAAPPVNDHRQSGSKHKETPTAGKRICAKHSPFLQLNYFVWAIIYGSSGTTCKYIPKLSLCLAKLNLGSSLSFNQILCSFPPPSWLETARLYCLKSLEPRLWRG